MTQFKKALTRPGGYVQEILREQKEKLVESEQKLKEARVLWHKGKRGMKFVMSF